jgi:uncharacterized protein (TIGR02118 family)
MFKFVTIYRRVDDDQKLEDFFSSVHLPLTEQLPHVIKTEVSRVEGKPGGQSRFHLMYEVYFESRDLYERAFLSEAGIKLMQVLKPWNDGKITTLFFCETFEE